MKSRLLLSTVLSVTAVCIPLLAHAQIPANYNHQVTGISVQDNKSTSPTSFGFTTGSTVSFLAGGTYSLTSIRSFGLLYNNDSGVNYTTQTTVPIGSAVFGAKQDWSPQVLSGKTTGWQDSFHAQGSQKPGNIAANSTTGLVFNISGPANPLPMYVGFDLAVFVGSGQSDPFGNGVRNAISTGRVFESFAAVVSPQDVVPEPGSLALLVGMGVTTGGFLFRRRIRRK